jgi:acetyl-CoA carboxylase carboxyltransferase component
MADMDSVFGYHPVMEEGISNVTATNSVELGTRVIWKGEEYVYCYNAGGAQISPSYGVKLVTGASGYSVAATHLSSVANPQVGVVKHATMAAADYGWVMVKGFTSLEAEADSTITGDYVNICMGQNGTFHEVNALTDAVHVGTFAMCGYGLNVDTASGGSFYGFIQTGF